MHTNSLPLFDRPHDVRRATKSNAHDHDLSSPITHRREDQKRIEVVDAGVRELDMPPGTRGPCYHRITKISKSRFQRVPQPSREPALSDHRFQTTVVFACMNNVYGDSGNVPLAHRQSRLRHTAPPRPRPGTHTPILMIRKHTAHHWRSQVPDDDSSSPLSHSCTTSAAVPRLKMYRDSISASWPPTVNDRVLSSFS